VIIDYQDPQLCGGAILPWQSPELVGQVNWPAQVGAGFLTSALPAQPLTVKELVRAHQNGGRAAPALSACR
jgi:hypothetical protein